MKILLFGDSITYGAWDPEGSGWATRLRRYVDLKSLPVKHDEYHHVYNLGVCGDNSSYLLERFERELGARRRREQACAIVFAIGVNDSLYFHETGLNAVTPDKFEENLEQLISLAKKYTTKIVFVGLLPVDDSKMDPVPWAPNISLRTEHIRTYNNTVGEVCQKNKIDFIDLFDSFIQKGHLSLLDDGIHPNQEGHAIVFEIISKALVEKGWI